jgi:GxxExxY protein
MIEDTGRAIVDSVIKVHRILGPGLLESAYQGCLAYELKTRGHHVALELQLPVRYEEIEIEAGYRIDMLVDNQIVIENKAVKELLPIHRAQILTYLKLSNIRLGYLVNWNVPVAKNGIKRVVNNL